ncbi:MAG: cupin domain-containing protein [Mycobacteriales bacterium]
MITWPEYGDSARTSVVGPADAARGTATLALLVGDVPAFLARHWERQPVVRSGADPAFAQALLSIADIDGLLTERAQRLPTARVVRDGASVPAARFTTSARIGSTTVGDLLDPAKLTSEFAAGSTISLQGLHRYWPPLTEFCRSLEAALTHPVQANAYLSPPGATGLSIHHDTHDVFVLQVEGSKHFDVYEPVTWLPIAGQHWTSSEPPCEPAISVDLQPGDCLYMPRGWRHRAYTTDSHSLHLTIGVLGYTWLSLLTVLAAELADDATFREALPAGFAHDADAFAAVVAARLDALRAWLDGAKSAELAEALVRRFVTGQRAPTAGLQRTIHPLSIGPETAVRRVPYARCLLRAVGDCIEAVLADRVVSFPAHATPVLHAIASTPRFCASELPDDLDLDSRLVVVRRLVTEGLLEAG